MSNITIGASQISGFQPNGIGADIALSGVTVTLNSDQVTFANPLPVSVLGLSGWKISLGTPAVTYTVESVESRTSLTLTSQYLASSGTVTGTLHKFVVLRVYVLNAFTPSGESYVAQAGSPGSTAWFRRYGVSVIHDGTQNVAYVPEIVLPATTNSNVPTARYFAGLYTKGDSGGFIQAYPGCVDQWQLDHETTPTSWAQICDFNTPAPPTPNLSPDDFVTERELDARLPSGTANQLLYFAATGDVLTSLDLSSDFTIVSDELQLSSSSGIDRVQEEGVNLPQQNTINFVGSSFTAADDAGNSRTNITADADLNALAGNSTNGFWARTGAGTGSARTLQQPAAGITITNPAGTAGDPTFALANDLAALEGLGSTGIAVRSAVDTWVQRTLQQPAAGLTITNPAGIAGDPTLVLANDLAALEGLGSTGIAVRSAADTWVQRTITGTANQITLADGNGVAGNPTISLPTIVFIGTAGGSPAAGTLKGPDASGSNIAGANMIFAGGPGTGNAAPGLAAFKYPLTGASGSVVQSLSSADFPPWVQMHVRNNGTVTVANTTTETSILGASQESSTKTIEAGLARAGRIFHVKLYGLVTTTGTPTLRVRIKLGATTISDTTAVTMSNNTSSGNSGLYIEAVVNVLSIGATGSVVLPIFKVTYATINGGAVNSFSNSNTGGTTIDFTAAQTFDVTVEWGAASVSNSVQIFSSVIEMSR